MNRQERKELQKFVDDYDRGRAGEGVVVPAFVLEGLRDALVQVKPSDTIPCLECGEESTWQHTDGTGFCPLHPTEEYEDGPSGVLVTASEVWRRRYQRLTDSIVVALGKTTLQEAQHDMFAALGQDEL